MVGTSAKPLASATAKPSTPVAAQITATTPHRRLREIGMTVSDQVRDINVEMTLP